jgi:hypothetical protein
VLAEGTLSDWSHVCGSDEYVEAEISEVIVTCGINLCGESKRDDVCSIKLERRELRGCDLGGSSQRDELGISKTFVFVR